MPGAAASYKDESVLTEETFERVLAVEFVDILGVASLVVETVEERGAVREKHPPWCDPSIRAPGYSNTIVSAAQVSIAAFGAV